MTATNHALTGAIIGLTIHQPLLAIPLALASHYALDAIPHADGLVDAKTKSYRLYLLAEASLCFLVVLALALTQPEYWWLGAVCAFAAASPDFMWIKGFLAEQKGKKWPKPKYWFSKLHAKVQWFAKPIGVVVELAWAAACVSILAILIKS